MTTRPSGRRIRTSWTTPCLTLREVMLTTKHLRVVDYPLEAINEAFADQDAGRFTRASLVTQ